MDTNDQLPVSELLRSTAIPIAQLSPYVDRLEESSIHSVVTLLWPYSSSTKSLSLLLVEPDFRLRRSNGQVKVLFHGNIAEAVAKSHVGIGDKVYLSLARSRLVKNDVVAQQTPGKGVSWDVHFDASASLEIWRDSKLLSVVKIDPSSPPSPIPDNRATTPATPAANGITHATGPLGSTSWQSPAFLESSRVSFGFTDTAVDPFVEEDGYVPRKGRKRPRFSMRSSEWRVVDEPEIPGEKDLPEDWMAIFDEELDTGSDVGEESVAQDADASVIPPTPEAAANMVPAGDSSAAMVDTQPNASDSSDERPTDHANEDAQFLRPSIGPKNVTEFAKQNLFNRAFHLPIDTPRLQPVPSPGLPDPSPLATTSNSPGGYFTSAVNIAAAVQSVISTVSVSEAVSEPRDSATPPQVVSDGEALHLNQDDAVTVYTDDVQVLPDSVPPSDEAAPSSPISDNKMATSTIALGDETDAAEGKALDNSKVDIAEGVAPGVHLEESDSELEPKIENEEDEEAESIGTRRSDRGEEWTRVEHSSERLSQEAGEESDRMSVTRSEKVYYDVKVAVPLEDDQARLAQDESLSEESRETSEDPGQSYEYGDEDEEEDEVEIEDEEEDEVEIEDEDGIHRRDLRTSDQGEYEEDFNEDEVEEEEEEADRPENGYGYDDSESEVESYYREERYLRFRPKNAEPEIIVLDSDSEDELSAQHPTSATRRETDEMPTSDEGSDAREDRYDLDKEIDDQEDLQDYEAENGQKEDDDRRMDYKVEDELEDEVRGDDQSVVDERPADEWPSESEQMYWGSHDKDLAEDHYEDVQERPKMEMEAMPAEQPESFDQSPALDELPVSHEYPELQPVIDHPHGPGHDSLDYLAAISETVERMHAGPGPKHSGYNLAIDPGLYEYGTSQGNMTADVGPDEDFRERSVEANNESNTESPESKHSKHLALQLDGAAPPPIFADSNEVSHRPIRYGARQLVTPGPSQLAEVDRTPGLVDIRGEMLPTPNLTQDFSTSILAANLSTSVKTETRTFNGSEDGGSPLVAAEKFSPVVPKHEDEGELEPPMVVVDTNEPVLSIEDQDLQASIEVDEGSQAGINGTHLTPVDRYYPGLRSKFSYFAPLATLIDHYNALVDTISIASEVRPATKATSGRKDFILTLQLTDQSMAGTTVYAQILRPYKPALPSLQEGDAILLRNFRVKSFDHSVILVSDSASAWAVFSSASPEEPEMNGPPVELGTEENTLATDLRQWYLEGGMAMVADNQLQASVGRESRGATPESSIAQSDAGSVDMALREARGDTSSSRGSRRRKSGRRRITIHELRDGRRYTEVGSSPGEDSIHELRDGTVYANL
ncbi:hypothetical protein BDW59DRAFT_172077 [Aspergillus cavernicola]|uniref:Telomeric single stranded DNA binding POT1/Cdc13 domain-containing protein n=1 Tax=Aspergillus cavernicola TaxID=176166 RepID=A0ABR4IE13_9EURO